MSCCKIEINGHLADIVGHLELFSVMVYGAVMICLVLGKDAASFY